MSESPLKPTKQWLVRTDLYTIMYDSLFIIYSFEERDNHYYSTLFAFGSRYYYCAGHYKLAMVF